MFGRFLVFCYQDEAPRGGSGDFVGAFDSLADAEQAAVIGAEAVSISPDIRNAEIYDVSADKWRSVALENYRKAS